MARTLPGPVVSNSRGAILSDINFQARVVHPQASGAEVLKEGYLVAPTDISVVTATLWNMTTAQIAGTVTVNSTNFSAILINDDQWTQDLIGRNFLINVPSSLFATPSHYRLIIDLTLTNGGRRLWAHDRTTESLTP